MIFRQKLLYTALGGVLMLVGMLFSSISPLTAQRDVFGETTIVGQLTVVDKDGKARVRLSANEKGGTVFVLGKRLGDLVHLFAGDYGGVIHVSQESLVPLVRIKCDGFGGRIETHRVDGGLGSGLSNDDLGGRAFVMGKDQVSGVTLHTGNTGNRGLVSVYDKDGKRETLGTSGSVR